MKLKKACFLLAGVFNCLIGGLSAMFGLFSVFLRKVIRSAFSESDTLDLFVDELVKADPSYDYLLNATQTEIVNEIMKIVWWISLVFFVIGAIWIMFGIFNVVLSKQYQNIFNKKKWFRWALVILSWLCLWFNIANILTTIGVFANEGKGVAVNEKLYSANDDSGEI